MLYIIGEGKTMSCGCGGSSKTKKKTTAKKEKKE